MSYNENDNMNDSRNLALGISAQDFTNFLREEGWVSDFELRSDPAIVCKLLEKEECWNSYLEDRYDRFLTKTNNKNERLKT